MWHFMKNSLNVHNLHKCAITAAYICISGKISDKIKKIVCQSRSKSPACQGFTGVLQLKKKGGNPVKIKLNPDKEMVKTVREGLKRTGGYCPCMLERSPDTKCMCKAFREQKEPGFCHCRLYYKTEEDD